MTGDCHVRFCESRGVRFPPATHQTPPSVQQWLKPHPRFHMHFTPTYSSWLNQVERWFGDLTDKTPTPRRAHRVQALKTDIRTCITAGTKTPNRSPGPRPPTTSSNDSPHISSQEFLAQDTSAKAP